MKKSLLIIPIAALSLVSCGSTGSSSTSTNTSQSPTQKVSTAQDATKDTENTEATTAEAVESDEISIVSHYLTTNHSGDTILVIEYAWTNTFDEPKAFSYAVSDSVFQNGIECSDLVIIDDVDSSQQLNKVQPGITHNIKIGYKLQDKTNVNVVVKRLTGNKVLLDQTIDLGGGEGKQVSGDVKDTSITVANYHIATDYKDEKVLVVEYDFYNGENKNAAWSLTFEDTAYQNGIECSDLVFGVDEVNAESVLAEIQPGVSAKITVGYKLNDDSPVTLEVKRLFSDKVYLNETIDIR